jgi:hypothetical protein
LPSLCGRAEPGDEEMAFAALIKASLLRPTLLANAEA